MDRDDRRKREGHTGLGILMGICLGALLCIGIKVYEEYAQPAMWEQVAEDEAVFSMQDQQQVEETEAFTEEESVDEVTMEEDIPEEETELAVIEKEELIEESAEEAGTETALMEESQEEQETENDRQYICIGNQRVNIRENGSLNGKVIGMLQPGTTVTVLAMENGWAHISVNGMEGYVIDTVLQAVQ